MRPNRVSQAAGFPIKSSGLRQYAADLSDVALDPAHSLDMLVAQSEPL